MSWECELERDKCDVHKRQRYIHTRATLAKITKSHSCNQFEREAICPSARWRRRPKTHKCYLSQLRRIRSNTNKLFVLVELVIAVVVISFAACCSGRYGNFSSPIKRKYATKVYFKVSFFHFQFFLLSAVTMRLYTSNRYSVMQCL